MYGNGNFSILQHKFTNHVLMFNPKQRGNRLKVIHRDMSSAYFFLIVDLRERGTLLQQKNGSKKSQAQKI